MGTLLPKKNSPMNHVRLFLTLALALTLTLASPAEAEAEWSSHTRATLGAVPSLSLETLTRPSRELVNQVLASFPATEEEAETYATVLANRKAIEAALGESSPVEDTRGAQQMLADCPKLTPRTPPSTIGELKPVDVGAVVQDMIDQANNLVLAFRAEL